MNDRDHHARLITAIGPASPLTLAVQPVGDVALAKLSSPSTVAVLLSPWLLPLLYLLLALTLMLWAGMRYSNCGRGLFIVTVGIVLIVLASAFFFLRAIGNTEIVGVGAAVTFLGAAMAIVASGSLS